MSYYARNPHYDPDDFSEDRERLEACEAEASRFFESLTKEQKAFRDETFAVIAPYRGSPRWDRERDRADFIFAQSTAEASRLTELALRDLMTLGEISQTTYYEADQLIVERVMQREAAE